MKSYTEKLHDELLGKLDELNRSYDPLMLSDPRLHLITQVINQIKEKLTTYSFKTEDDEVQYFKNCLPKMQSLYFYYKDKMDWDRIAVLGTDNARYTYHDRIFSQAENFRADNRTFCDYYRDGTNELDYFYFSRNSPANLEMHFDVRQIIDASTPPLHTELLAKFIAYTRLEFDSKKAISENEETLSPVKADRTTLKWTAKQIDIIELGYALKEANAFNDGNVSLNEIFKFFRDSFDMEIGNSSRLFQDLVRRKSSSPLFLDLLKKKLLQRIDTYLN